MNNRIFLYVSNGVRQAKSIKLYTNNGSLCSKGLKKFPPKIII